MHSGAFSKVIPPKAITGTFAIFTASRIAFTPTGGPCPGESKIGLKYT